MGIKEIVDRILGKEPDLDLRSTRCCDTPLKWNLFIEGSMDGFRADCGECNSTYIQKTHADIFIGDDKPKLYVQRAGESKYKHLKCDSVVNALNYVLEGSEGVIMQDFRGESRAKINSVPYCPKCEVPERIIPIGLDAVIVPPSPAERYINRILSDDK